jgi:glycosyltransferase involved in cell wall biosynthesis
MRVLHVSAYYAPAFVYGGPPRSIHGLCRALCRLGVDLQVFTTDANGSYALPPEYAGSREYDGVPVHYFPRSRPRWPIGSRSLAAALADELQTTDLLHIHGLWNRVVWTAARAARESGVPYVLSPRGMLQGAALAHGAWRKRLGYAAIERHVVQGAALLHATSGAERLELTTSHPRARVALIPNGIDIAPGLASMTRDELGVPADRPLILFVGRLHRIKRVDLLLDAFALVRAAHPQAHLVIAGPDEQRLRGDLERAHPELEGRVTWCGAVDAARRDALLAHARALVACSDSESFGMTVLEAMAASCPVVVTRTCGWTELARLGAGLVVDQRPDAIAAALATLLSDATLARTMGRRGYELASSTYSWPGVAHSVFTAYRDTIDRWSVRPMAG